LPSALRTRLAASLAPTQDSATPVPQAPRPLARFMRRNWPELLLPGAVGLLLWAALNWK